MATTRKPLPVGRRCELHYTIGSHHYLLSYREGQEPQAREAVARWARNRDLAFSWTDASAVGEAIGYDEPDDDPVAECNCEMCRSFPARDHADELRRSLYPWTLAFLTCVVAWLAWR